MASPYHSKALPPGTTLREWELEDVLGAGGFAIVYKARHKHFDDSVAIKEFFPSGMTDRIDGVTVAPTNSGAEEAFEFGRHKFLEEAKILYRLSQPRRHPNLVCVKALFELNGTAYIVMDFESGQPLSRQLRKGRQFNEKTLAAIFRKVVLGLELAHHAGVWHRDIKPANILVDEQDHPVLIDFGAAKVEDSSGMTQTRMTFYTPPYAAFEQYVKKQPIGPWTDIYALGVTLYLCVTGKKPDEPLDRLGDPGTPLAEGDWPGFSKHFLRWVDAAMAVMPHDRPQSLAAWLKLLDDRPDDEDPATQTRTETLDEDETRWRAYDGTKPNDDTESRRSASISGRAPATGTAPRTGPLSGPATEGTVFATQTSSKLAALWGAARADLALVKDVAVEREAAAAAAIARAATIVGGDTLAVPLRELLESAHNANAETLAAQEVLEAAQNVGDAESAHEAGVSARQSWRQALGRINVATAALLGQLDSLEVERAQLAEIQAHCAAQSAALATAAAEVEHVAETARAVAQVLADPAEVMPPLDLALQQLQQAHATQSAIYLKVAEASDLSTAEHGLATLAALKIDFDAAVRAVQASSTAIQADIAARLEAQRQQALQAVAATAAAETIALAQWQAAVNDLENRQMALADRACAFADIDLTAVGAAGIKTTRAGETARSALANAVEADDPGVAQTAIDTAQVARDAAEAGLQNWRARLADLEARIDDAEAAALAAAEVAAAKSRDAAEIAAQAAAESDTRDHLAAQVAAHVRAATDTKLAADDVGIAAEALTGLDAGLGDARDALGDADAAIGLLKVATDRTTANQYAAQASASCAAGTAACDRIETALTLARAAIAARTIELQAEEQAAATAAQIAALIAPDARDTAGFEGQVADGQTQVDQLISASADLADADALVSPARAAVGQAAIALDAAREAHGLLTAATTLAAAERAVTQARTARETGEAQLAALPALVQDCQAAITQVRADIVAATQAAVAEAAAEAARAAAAEAASAAAKIAAAEAAIAAEGHAAAEDDDADRTVFDSGEPDDLTVSSPRDEMPEAPGAAEPEILESDSPTMFVDRAAALPDDAAASQGEQDETRIATPATDAVTPSATSTEVPTRDDPTPAPATSDVRAPDLPPPTAAQPLVRQPATVAPEQADTPKKSPMLLIIIAVAVLAVAVVAFLVFGRGGTVETPPATTETTAPSSPAPQPQSTTQPAANAPTIPVPKQAPTESRKPESASAKVAPMSANTPAPHNNAAVSAPKPAVENKPAATKPEAAKPEPVKIEPAKAEPARIETPKPIVPEPAKADTAKVETPKPEVPKAVAPAVISGPPPCVRPSTTSPLEWVNTKKLMKAAGKCS